MECRLAYMQSQVEGAQSALAIKHLEQEALEKRANVRRAEVAAELPELVPLATAAAGPPTQRRRQLTNDGKAPTAKRKVPQVMRSRA